MQYLACLRRFPPSAHMRTGRQGEDAAVRHLRSHGFAVIARNVRLGRDEIDILAFDPSDRVLVFVEVKARRAAHGPYLPALNLTASKIQAMRRAARRWVDLHAYDGGWRMDAIFVRGGSVTDHVQEIGST